MFFGSIDEKTKPQIQLGIGDWEQYKILMDRRIYLTSEIKSADCDCDEYYRSPTMQMVEDIMEINRYDAAHNIAPEDRKPIRLYINSPGGDTGEGFSLISAIELSKTPIYTINIGQWASMAFLIGIAGHKRFSMPYMTFLLHDGISIVCDSGSKVQDRVDFDKRYNKEVVRAHILKHGKMGAKEYDKRIREEIYMVPEDAIEYGFIDKIVTDINDIL